MPNGSRLTGGNVLKAKLRRFADKFPDEVGRALYLETEVEVTEVKRNTPVETGELRASVHQEGPTREWRHVYTTIVAGGPAAPYALYVHEDLEAFHKVGGAKYIESTLFASRPFMAARVAKRIELNRALA